MRPDATGKPVIGVIGAIGAGKSTVAQILASLGCVVSDSDQLAREALRDREVRQVIVELWGDEVILESGAIDRSALAKIVFTDADARRRLEGIIHPWIGRQRERQFAEAPSESVALVIDAPLLLEAGLDRECDAVIFVDADRKVRLERLAAGRGWTAEELARRESAQMGLDEKRRRADHVLENNGAVGELTEKVRRILSTILDTCRA